MSAINKILIFRLSSIGDIVLTTALLRCVREKYPESQIDFVVKKQFADILKCVPFVSNVIELDSKKGFAELFRLRKNFRKEKYQIVLDIHKNWRSLFLCRLIGGKVFTFNKHVFNRWMLTTFHRDIYKTIRPVYLRFIDAAKAIDVAPDGKLTELIVPDAIQSAVDAMFLQSGIDMNKKIVAVCPGASFRNKQWQSDKFEAVSKRIVSELNIQVILLGGKKETDICNVIAKNSGAVNFAGKFDISQSIAALQRCSATVVNDTGMLHVSEALGVPVVGIYGPTARQFGYFPILPESCVAQVDDLNCRPCTKMGKNNCPKKHFLCMNEISVDNVFSLLSKSLYKNQ